MKKTLSLLAILALLDTTSNFAHGSQSDLIKWDTVGVEYTSLRIDDLDQLKLGGLGLGVSHEINELVYVTASTEQLTGDMSDSVFGTTYTNDFEITSYSASVGLKHAIQDNLQLFASFGLFQQELDVTFSAVGYGSASQTVNSDGFGFSFGARYAINEQLQIGGGISTTSTTMEAPDGEETESDDNSFNLSAQYFITNRVILQAGYGLSDDSRAFSIGFGYAY